MTILAILVLGGAVLYFMTEAERARLFGAILGAVGQARRAAMHRGARDSFDDALGQRTRLAIVTPVVAGLNAVILLLMIFAPGSISDPETLIAWGGNFAPRTTNGEWSRLVTAAFVHSGIFHLLVNTACLVQLGLILERLVGHVAFTAVYVAAAILASVVSLSIAPMSISVGASGAIFGMCGLFVAALFWGTLNRSSVTIPLKTLKTLAPAFTIFILFNLFSTDLATGAELAGLTVGLAGGFVLTRGVARKKPPMRLVASVLASTVLISLAAAAILRGVADVRPEIERILALEDRTAAIYQKAVDQFRLGAINAKALAHLIDRAIIPEVQAARARLKAIDGVPQEHEALVASADEYLRLRDESWRQRSDALHNANMPALRKADRTEHASLEALARLR